MGKTIITESCTLDDIDKDFVINSPGKNVSIKNARSVIVLACRNLSCMDATIGGHLWCDGATIEEHLWCDRAKFGGDLSCNDATISGSLWCDRATFGGSLKCNGATFGGSLRCNWATIEGHLWCNGATFTGNLSFCGATFGGSLMCNGATFGGSLSCNGAKVGGNLWCNGATFGGNLWCNGAKIGGNLYCYGATIGGVKISEPTEEELILIREIYAIISADPNLLKMSEWHCGTSHCLAGWCQVLREENVGELNTKNTNALNAGMKHLPSLSYLFFTNNEIVKKKLKELCE